jgi:hypothetical protein
MTNYSIDDGHGNAITAGLSAQTARQVAQRIANSRGESVYMYEDGSDADAEEIAPAPTMPTKKSAAQLQREIDAVLKDAKTTTRGHGGCFFFIPQTGQISERPPRSNYHAYQIPVEKRKFIEDWIEAAEVTSSGLEYPSGFIRTLDVLERQCSRKGT